MGLCVALVLFSQYNILILIVAGYLGREANTKSLNTGGILMKLTFSA